MQLYNTLTREIEEFVPLDKNNVRIYTCGPTVYRDIHIGNFRTYITADILVRTLGFLDFPVTSVMNITDVGHMRFSNEAQKAIDPIMEEAKHLKITPLELSKIYTDKFLKDAKKLNIASPTHMPKASDHVAEMIEIIKVLIEKGFAYEMNGDVYFDVKKFKDYGKLSGNTLDKMEQLMEAVRVSLETDKKDSADFALWKAQGDRVMGWESPWGMGVPGWHIECSAMSTKYLGNHFDIHAGGEDLVFPHHEDEIAQTEAFSSEKFVNYWVHSHYLVVDDEKMSRSKRNVYLVKDIEKKGYSPLAFRYLTYQTHYRARMNFTWEALESASIALEKLYEQAATFELVTTPIMKYLLAFSDAVSQDLNMPKAISVMWEMMRSSADDSEKAATLIKMDEVLGLKILEHATAATDIPASILELVEKREQLRKMKKFNLADQLRAQIEKKGFIIKDGDNGKTKVMRKV